MALSHPLGPDSTNAVESNTTVAPPSVPGDHSNNLSLETPQDNVTVTHTPPHSIPFVPEPANPALNGSSEEVYENDNEPANAPSPQKPEAPKPQEVAHDDDDDNESEKSFEDDSASDESFEDDEDETDEDKQDEDKNDEDKNNEDKNVEDDEDKSDRLPFIHYVH